MRFLAEVFVTLRPVVNDPEGLTILRGLHSIGFSSVAEVRSGKYLQVTIEEVDEGAARRRVDQIAREVLANPVIEEYRVQLAPLESPVIRGARRA
jgi:phosphoribosylformylglycinamidine synthase PurS subunit